MVFIHSRPSAWDRTTHRQTDVHSPRLGTDVCVIYTYAHLLYILFEASVCDITTWIPGLVEGEGTDYEEQGRTFSLSSIGDTLYSILYLIHIWPKV